MHPTLCAVPRISFTHPDSSLASDLAFIVRAMLMISSIGMLPLCLMFFSFFLSRGGSTRTMSQGGQIQAEGKGPLRARMTREEAEGTTDTCACRFWIVSWTVTRRPFHAVVALAISSPTFFGDCATTFSNRQGIVGRSRALTKPRGPILGASAEDAPTSPPVARK